MSELRSQLLATVKERILPVRELAVHLFGRGKQWLMPRQQIVSVVAGVVGVLVLLKFSGVTAAVAAVAAWIALRSAPWRNLHPRARRA